MMVILVAAGKASSSLSSTHIMSSCPTFPPPSAHTSWQCSSCRDGCTHHQSQTFLDIISLFLPHFIFLTSQIDESLTGCEKCKNDIKREEDDNPVVCHSPFSRQDCVWSLYPWQSTTMKPWPVKTRLIRNIWQGSEYYRACWKKEIVTYYITMKIKDVSSSFFPNKETMNVY